MNDIEKMRSDLERLQQRVGTRKAKGITGDDRVIARMIGRKVELERAIGVIEQLHAEVERLTDTNKQFGKIIHDQVVANQAAWIEWQHGKGAEAAMAWVQNGLLGPGHIPDESEPWAKDPQAYYDANKADPFPACHCGRPSNQLWMGHGACCHEHMMEIKRKVKADE
ncbi:hypothetical protein [Marinobacterium sp. BA1]|uniref:hypothetical protein n=1 Tax=Marinobacterium sp. BA1 TaxID=3138931 RepID=UPI0032E5CED4